MPTTTNPTHLRLLTRVAGISSFTRVRRGRGCRSGALHVCVAAGTSGADRARVAAFLAAICATTDWPASAAPEHFDSATVTAFSVPPSAFV